MRPDAKPTSVIRAVSKAIQAKFNEGDWLELGLITETYDEIKEHRRLLRSLDWNDPDYSANVLEMVPVVLGDRGRRADATSPQNRFSKLRVVEEFVGLQAWLSDHERALHDELYAGEGAAVLDELQAAAQQLGVPDVAEHAVRIRRSLHDDPAQAIGSSKELLETVLKATLGLHGTGPETKLDMPKLVKQANLELGLDAAGIRGDDAGAQHRRRLLGSLATIVNTAGELRNEGFGTGHGSSQGQELDVPTARLVIAAAVAVATFYIEAHAAASARQPDRSDDIPF
ncbi:MAG: abortive infection family protein [Solirubrobacteraceae bacterium]